MKLKIQLTTLAMLISWGGMSTTMFNTLYRVLIPFCEPVKSSCSFIVFLNQFFIPLGLDERLKDVVPVESNRKRQKKLKT